MREVFGFSAWTRCACVLCIFSLGGCIDTMVEMGSPSESARNRSVVARPGVSPRGASLVIADVDGPPETLRERYLQAFVAAAKLREVSLTEAAGAQYQLRAYLTASSVKTGARLSYVLDVYDRQGRRAQRLSDETTLPGGAAADPWQAADDKAVTKLAERAAADVAAFLSNTPEAIAAAEGGGVTTIAGERKFAPSETANSENAKSETAKSEGAVEAR